MKRVRMFCDWDNDSRQLIERLRSQTGLIGDRYRDILFVDDDDYDVAIGFNYVQANKMKARLILEPPEIYPPRIIDDVDTYSFVDTGGVHKTIYGLGFATAPLGEYPRWADRPKYMMMICSNKTYTPYHLKRLDVRHALIEIGLKIDFYGRGMGREIPSMSKHTVLPQYKFCIDFENSVNAVTDKYFDPIICGTVPISNALFIKHVMPSSLEYVDFELNYNQIVNRIVDIYNNPDDFYNLGHAQYEFLQGRLCLAKWIYERVNE